MPKDKEEPTTTPEPAVIWLPGKADPAALRAEDAEELAKAHTALPDGVDFQAALVPTFQRAKYTFMVSSFTAYTLRSGGLIPRDTDHIAESLSVSGGAAALTKTGPTPPEKWNLDRGTFPQGARWAIGPVDVTAADQSVSFAYSIVNLGATDPNVIDEYLRKGVTWISDHAIAFLDGLATDYFGPLVGALVDDQLKKWETDLIGFLFPDCDGVVAAAAVSMKGADLWAQTQNGGQLTGTFTHPGLPSHGGCGANSLYYTTWTCLRSA